jgi:hypothetical protein
LESQDASVANILEMGRVIQRVDHRSKPHLSGRAGDVRALVGRVHPGKDVVEAGYPKRPLDVVFTTDEGDADVAIPTGVEDLDQCPDV